ncbi:geranylgeranylglyceryl/heptaprenylglyceryl phosphate synthase [Membranicola marinus]|uniref:Geranylgeranylglyceryl phosphate synthase n=1 Tax=Membranihabitans marinus TaxID=1227546 RepID=A0A953LAP8_9BACT|nr:geranylgeranylglyceryl/heptaprenylglyceryl phosphate synthase [Membranihabitans marinus]MBY5957806.1 geranylgeranylglyceryl/heptaprenylglyceryl phosphate synthase [Membranihabitans marinus]
MIYDQFYSAHRHGRKGIALLIDPDNIGQNHLDILRSNVNQCHIDYVFVGGSLLKKDHLDQCLRFTKKHFDVPSVLFPGDVFQINTRADGILLLSLISGRNPELLIGKHVTAAPYLRRSNLEIIPTGYILVDGGRPTTVTYMSQTMPVPRDKPDIASCTASAGELLGLRVIYLDAGSGAQEPVSQDMIREVKKEIDIPLIVGGGIRNGDQAHAMCEAGADILVVGNAVEKDPSQLIEISTAINAFNEINQFT